MKLAALIFLAIFYTCLAFSKGKVEKTNRGAAEPFRHNVSFARPMNRAMQPATYYGKNEQGLVHISASLLPFGPYIGHCHGVMVHENYAMVPASCIGCQLGWEYLWWRICYTVDGYTYCKGVETIHTHPEYQGCWPHEDSISLLYIGELSQYYKPSVSKICPKGSGQHRMMTLKNGEPIYTEAQLVSKEECSSIWDWIFGASTGSCVCMIGNCLEKIQGMLVLSEPVEGEYCCIGLVSEYFLGCLLGQADVYLELEYYIDWIRTIALYN